MENTMNHVTGWGLVAFTCLTGGALLVNAAQAMAGTADFAYWHWVTLAALVYLCSKTVSWVMIARAAVRIRKAIRRIAYAKRSSRPQEWQDSPYSISPGRRAAWPPFITTRKIQIKGSR